MKVKLCFDAQFCGHDEVVVEFSDGASDSYIRSLFPRELGLEYDDNCYYERIKE